MLWFSDEGVALSGALRLLHGKALYTQSFSFLPPGSYVFVAAWFAVFGSSVLAVRLLASLVVAGVALGIFTACARFGRDRAIALVLALGWVAASQGYWTQVNHHYFSLCLGLGAVCLAPMPHGGRVAGGWRMSAAGAAGAAACLTTPTTGLVVLVALVAGFGRGVMAGAAAALAVAAVVGAYLVATGALAAGLYDTVLFPLLQYGGIQRVAFGSGAGAQSLVLVLLFPAAFILLLVMAARHRAALLAPEGRMVAVLALGGLASAFPRPDEVHIFFASALVLPFFAYGIGRVVVPGGAWRQGAVVALLSVALLPSVWAYGRVARDVQRWVPIDTRQGVITVPPFDVARGRMITEIGLLPASDGVFFFPYLMMLPYLTAHDQSGAFDVLLPAYSPPAQYQSACRAVAAGAAWMVIDTAWLDPLVLRTIFPAMPVAAMGDQACITDLARRAFVPVADAGGLRVLRRVGYAGRGRVEVPGE